MDDFIFIESLEAQMQAQGDKTALVFKGKETSYAQLSSLSNKVANALIEDGVKPHSRVAFMGNNSAIYFELLLGVQKTRAALVGVNSRLAPPEVAFVINDAQAEMIFVDRNYAPLIEKIIHECPKVRRVVAMDFDHADWAGFADWRDAQSDSNPGGDYNPDDDIIQLYTSGTTGHPKGCNSPTPIWAQHCNRLRLIGVDGTTTTMCCCVCPYFILPASMSAWSVCTLEPQLLCYRRSTRPRY